MHVLLALSSLAGRFLRGAVRQVPRHAASAALAVPYVLGLVLGLVVVAAVSIAAAARIGWADAHRRGRHGAA